MSRTTRIPVREAAALGLLLVLVSLRGAAQTVSLTASPASSGGSTIALTASIGGGAQVSALEWIMTYSSAVASASVSVGAASAAAAKTVACAPVASGMHCIAYGPNSTALAAGDIANTTFTLHATAAPGSATVTVSGVAASGASGAGVTASAPTSSVAIPSSGLKSLVCSPAAVATPAVVSCVATSSSGAPSGGLPIAVSSSSPALVVPAAVSIPAGATTVSFTGSAAPLLSGQTATVTATFGAASQSAVVNLGAAPPLTGFSCTPSGLGGGSTATCAVSISAAVTAPVVVALSGVAAPLSAPASATIPAGATTASFTISAGPIATNATETLVAGFNGGLVSAAVNLIAPPPVSGLTCNPPAAVAGSPIQCAVLVSWAAPPGGAAVAVSSSNAAISAPASVTVPAGANTVTFPISSTTMPIDEMSVISATSAGVTQSTPILVSYAAGTQINFLLRGQLSEIAANANGAAVTPPVNAKLIAGTVIIDGGAVNFTSANAGVGVNFTQCCSNSANAYYQFLGANVGQVFNTAGGQISFYLTSSYTFAQRLATASSARNAFDVRDANVHLFYFQTKASGNRLYFYYSIAGTTQFYYLPAGIEDAMYGAGVTMKVTMAWDGSTASLYINDTLVKSGPCTPVTPNWSSASLFDFGAYEYLGFTGYSSSDDTIGDFVVTGN